MQTLKYENVPIENVDEDQVSIPVIFNKIELKN